jgi:hypothetical protein
LQADEAALAADHEKIAALERLVAEQRSAIASLERTVADLSRRSATDSEILASRGPDRRADP